MENDLKLANESLKLIRKDLSVEEVIPELTRTDPFEELHIHLTRVVQHFLDHDFSGLINAMYRIDIPEDRVTDILEYTAPGSMAEELAKAIIEREKLKVITRQKYSPPKS